jgi:hypothetical protein
MVMQYKTGAARRTAVKFVEFSAVHLGRTVTHMGATYPEGTLGIIVDVGPDGWYEVELFSPVAAVVTLSQDDLR